MRKTATSVMNLTIFSNISRVGYRTGKPTTYHSAEDLIS